MVATVHKKITFDPIVWIMGPIFSSRIPRPHSTARKMKGATARFLMWVMETVFGFLMFAIMFGNVVMPQWLAISTSGWDSYSILLWGFLPMIALAAFTMRVIDSAKMGYVRPF